MASPLLLPDPPEPPPRPLALRLVAHFKTAGWRYPFDEGDGVEVWEGFEHVGTLSAGLLFHVVRHYLQGARLDQAVQQSLTPTLRPASPPPRLRHSDGRHLRGRPT